MIRINLLKSFGANSSEILQQLDEQKNVQSTFVKKILVVTLGVIALVIFEFYNIPKITDERTVLMAQHAELVAFNQKREALKIEIEKYEKDRIRLNRQTEFLQKIQRERIGSVNLLVKIKEVMPPNLWLKSIKIEGQQIDIKGEADSEKEINEFNIRLSAVSFLKDVIVLSIELKPPDQIIRTPLKTFSMKAIFTDPSSLTAANEAQR